MGRRRRRTFRMPEQLSFDLVVKPPPVTELERLQVGHFVGIRLSDRTWNLTVAPEQPSYIPRDDTPQIWWSKSAPGEFSLHSWSQCRSRIVAGRDEPEAEEKAIELRSEATRWLRSFNEAFQAWRMTPRY